MFLDEITRARVVGFDTLANQLERLETVIASESFSEDFFEWFHASARNHDFLRELILSLPSSELPSLLPPCDSGAAPKVCAEVRAMMANPKMHELLQVGIQTVTELLKEPMVAITIEILHMNDRFRKWIEDAKCASGYFRLLREPSKRTRTIDDMIAAHSARYS